MFDLATRRPLDAVTVTGILDPVDGTTDTGITLTLAGRYSAHYRAAQFALAEQVRGAEADGQPLAERLLELLARCVLAWDGLSINGATPACTPENVLAVFREFPWLAEQVQARYLGADAFFAPARSA